ncbi:MAG: DUF4956 domain-containing protein [Acidobacteria bacterium]|uniref:DUF4956 domain-containing protein n=1 Tax=Candidatus Polarisedimenticola svalbardensis TaxID=2886004 RepID=A0A8J6Y4F2_9BACT|nr:DUF4956 domain-containing protein [Candidatus Polarisedimenticola svalbardensis]
MQEFSLLSPGAPLSITDLLINLVIGAILAGVLKWHFGKFASTLSNRGAFAQVFPFILLTTILIISVVKSSLALSLGLVGALSIVRFRTPIKEPEELAYLFMAISVGLGLGADQRGATIAAAAVILVVVALYKRAGRRIDQKSMFLSVRYSEKSGEGNFLNSVSEILGKHTLSQDMRRVDTAEGQVDATFFVDIEHETSLVPMLDELRVAFPGIDLTFIDQNRLPSV